MKTINDNTLLKHYINKYNINDCFEKDMTPFMTIKEYERNEDILVAGEEMYNFYFIVEGKVKIYNTLENGKTVLIRFSQPLSELGSVEILQENKTIRSCVTSLYKTVVISISFSDIELHAKDDVKLYKFLVRKLSQKLYTLSNAASLNMTYPFKNRFASYLLSISSLNNIERIEEIKMNNLTELATFLGTSYRHLNRVIKDFEDKGIIIKNKDSFKILNFTELKSLSGGFYE